VRPGGGWRQCTRTYRTRRTTHDAHPKRVAMLAALLTLALFVAACGSSSSDKGGTVKSSAGQRFPGQAGWRAHRAQRR